MRALLALILVGCSAGLDAAATGVDARSDTSADASCPPGFTCVPTDGGSDAPTDAAVDARADVAPVDSGFDVAIDTGADVQPVDTGVDVQPTDTGVDVRPADTGPSCVSMTVGNCGGIACATPANGTAACVACACTLGACAAGFGDCDHNPTDGCEVNLATDPANCGGCGAGCAAVTVQHATTACVGMMCGFTCADGWGNCDGIASNGCEAFERYDDANCGRCGAACPSSYRCIMGVCSP